MGAGDNDGTAQSVPNGYVAVDIIARDRDGAKLLAELLQAGLIKNGASYGALASGFVPQDMVSQIAGMEGVVSASRTGARAPLTGPWQTAPGGLVPAPSTADDNPGSTYAPPTAVHPSVGSAATYAPPTAVHPIHSSGVTGTSAAYAAPTAVKSTDAAVQEIGTAGPLTQAGSADAMQASDIIAKNGDGAALLKSLQDRGLISGGASYGSMVSGFVKAGDLSSIRGYDTVASATVSNASTSVGKVTNEADHALAADTARSTFSVDGSGIKVGIISDSFNMSGNADTTQTDIASNDLPTATNVLYEYTPGMGDPPATDEGRGMAQIVHDLAPGASIDFATAEGGQAVFAQHILALAQDGCKVIVDDIGYPDELSYQDGVIAQAIDQVRAMGVTYLSSAGNNGKNGYEGAFSQGAAFSYKGVNYTYDNFAPNTPTLSFTAGAVQTVTLEWSEPGASAGGKGSQSDLDLFITDASGNTVYNRQFSDGTIEGLSNNINGDPVEVAAPTLTQGDTYYIRVGLKSGTAPADIRVILQDDGSGAVLDPVSSNTNTGTFFGHAAATGNIGVGAAYFMNTPPYSVDPAKAEDFSSQGPDNVYYDTAGNQIAVDPRMVDLTGADGGETTFFGDGSGPNGYPQFYGTSAAAPSVAAVVALMLQKNPSLTPDQIQSILVASVTPAVDSTGTSDPRVTGAGLVNAEKALEMVPAVCFAGGTRIRLASGADVAMEELAVGDLVETATGDVRPIRWLGHRTLRPRDSDVPSNVWPVRVSAGAFGDGLPERDLMLSPGHPVLVGADADNAGGHLVPIMCLINGTTIRRIEAETVTYWHVELDEHDVLLAEGLPAESYLDWGDRAFFTEAADHALANPDFVVPGLAARCRPVALDGPLIEAERRRLDAVFATRLSTACDWPSHDDDVGLAPQ